MSLISELKRRNVFKVTVAYIVVGWLLLQVAEILVPALRLPEWVLTATIYFLIIGFLPALIFAWAFEMTPEGLKKEKDVQRDKSITYVTGRKLDFAIIGLLAIAVIYLVLDKLGPDESVVESVEVVEVAESAPAVEKGPPPKSIAVLPFANMSEDAGNEFFADGISEEILNALAKVHELKVAGRTSSFAFKGRNEDLRLIGQTLNVSHILEGSVRKAGNTVRVTAQLIKVEDGYHMWSETYDRELTDIFAIQDEIAGAILAELKTELIDGEQVASSRTDPRAYEKYLQAKQLMYTRLTPNLVKAEVLLNEALALDDTFAPAWAQRSILSNLLSEEQYGHTPIADARAQALKFAEHALELDDGLAEAWASLGLYNTNRPGIEATRLANEYLERALQINPGLVDASNWLGGSLATQHRMLDALAVYEHTFDRDPLYPPVLGNLVFGYIRQNRLGDLAAILDRVRPFLEDRPNFNLVKSLQAASLGDHAESLAYAKAAYAVAPSNNFVIGSVGRAYFFLNDFEPLLELDWGSDAFRIRALVYLGRTEEASILARQEYEKTGIPDALFNFMVLAGQYKELVEFFEQRWSGIEDFQSSHSPTFGFGNRNLLYLAKAYLETGRDQQFELAMRLARVDHDRQLFQGADWEVFHVADAFFWTLANDHDKAIASLQKAIDRKFVSAPRLSRMWPLLKPLEGDPRYEALQAQSLQILNRNRMEAGLEPLEPAYSL